MKDLFTASAIEQHNETTALLSVPLWHKNYDWATGNNIVCNLSASASAPLEVINDVLFP